MLFQYFFQSSVLLFKGSKFGVLLLAIAGACRVHTLFDAAFGDKSLFQMFQIGDQHFVGHTTNRYSHVAEFLGRHLLGKFLIIGIIIMLATKRKHTVETGCLLSHSGSEWPFK